jgi:hypothetical protein
MDDIAARYDRTFQLRHYPLPKLVGECLKCGRKGRFDKARLIDKLGEIYPVHQAVDRRTKDWECDKPDRIKAYALHPNAMYSPLPRPPSNGSAPLPLAVPTTPTTPFLA